jgi:hypothetical protein
VLFFFVVLAARSVVGAVLLAPLCPATGITISNTLSTPARRHIAGRPGFFGEVSTLISPL